MGFEAGCEGSGFAGSRRLAGVEPATVSSELLRRRAAIGASPSRQDPRIRAGRVLAAPVAVGWGSRALTTVRRVGRGTPRRYRAPAQVPG